MRLKSELYKNEQIQIMNQIINILQLDNDNGFILYELDNDTDKQTKIMELIPIIRKYFTFRNIIGASWKEGDENCIYYKITYNGRNVNICEDVLNLCKTLHSLAIFNKSNVDIRKYQKNR